MLGALQDDVQALQCQRFKFNEIHDTVGFLVLAVIEQIDDNVDELHVDQVLIRVEQILVHDHFAQTQKNGERRNLLFDQMSIAYALNELNEQARVTIEDVTSHFGYCRDVAPQIEALLFDATNTVILTSKEQSGMTETVERLTLYIIKTTSMAPDLSTSSTTS